MKLKILNFIFLPKSEVFLVFIEIKQIDLDTTYLALHLTIIKFPILEISSEWCGGFTSVPYNILEAFISAARCSISETKTQFIFSN